MASLIEYLALWSCELTIIYMRSIISSYSGNNFYLKKAEGSVRFITAQEQGQMCRSVFFQFFLLLILLCNGFINFGTCQFENDVKNCKDSERRALVKFKNGLLDPGGRLDSWNGHNCCKWRGVSCDNTTGYVVKLDLHNPNFSFSNQLNGKLDPSFAKLKHLQYLNLQGNDFSGTAIPEFLGFMNKLRYLDLSNAGFSGEIPHQLGNLSNLEYLDLASYASSCNQLTAHDNLGWIRKLHSLEYLDMSYANHSEVINEWAHVISSLPALQVVRCAYCYLTNTKASVINTSFSIQELKLPFNSLNSIPKWVTNISSLVSLDLHSNVIHAPIPLQLSNIPNLEYLNLNYNSLNSSFSALIHKNKWERIKIIHLQESDMHGHIPESIGNITSLIQLDLSYNRIMSKIPGTISNLYNLQSLDLSGNQLNGGPHLEEFCVLRNLEFLSLENCGIEGQVPVCLGRLSNLISLDISSNSLKGTVSEEQFKNLSEIKTLSMSFNQIVFQLASDWVPPFQIVTLELGSCRLGPKFPTWLRTQKSIWSLDLSNTSIIDTVPIWLWDLVSNAYSLNLSTNHIEGMLPQTIRPPRYMDLSSNHFWGPLPAMEGEIQGLVVSDNQFSGPLPLEVFHTHPPIEIFIAGNNNFSGLLPAPTFCTYLLGLDLSNNRLSGEIPPSLGNCTMIRLLDLSQNALSGPLPSSFGHMNFIRFLHLNGNQLYGKIPASLRKCSKLETINLGENKFSGIIPVWFGKSYTNLKILRLRSNNFEGSIPHQLSLMTSLQVLDISSNFLSGVIPHSFGSLVSMKFQQTSEAIELHGVQLRGYYYIDRSVLSLKGLTLEVSKVLSVFKSIDLSNNNLTGQIPHGLTNLSGLLVLNLSRNNLLGKLPEAIGDLKSLESLDLSHNQLSGMIPQSLSSMTSLSVLNLSYNRLVGRIPTGPQLQTFTELSYLGNYELCGPPLKDICPTNETLSPPATDQEEDNNEEEKEASWIWVFTGVASGFVLGFWGFCGTLILKKSWRNTCFQFFDIVINSLLDMYLCARGQQ